MAVSSDDIGRNIYRFDATFPSNFASNDDAETTRRVTDFVNECINVFPEAPADYDQRYNTAGINLRQKMLEHLMEGKP